MEETSKTILTLIQILVAFGAFEGIKAFFRYLKNRKRDKSKDISELYKDYSKSIEDYMKQTTEMERTITDLRNRSIEAEAKMTEMSLKLDEKNKLLECLGRKISDLTSKLEEVLKRADILETVKCERENCDQRIPPTIKTAKSKKHIVTPQA